MRSISSIPTAWGKPVEKATRPGRSGNDPESASGFRQLVEVAGAEGFAAGNSVVRLAKGAWKSTETGLIFAFLTPSSKPSEVGEPVEKLGRIVPIL